MTKDEHFLYDLAGIRGLEEAVLTCEGISIEELMDRAGKAVWETFQSYWPDAEKIAIFCGMGNNGGDGFVMANLAAKAGKKVTVFLSAAENELSEMLKRKCESAKEAGVLVQTFQYDNKVDADVIVDAILGIGFQGELRVDAEKMISCMNAQALPILAVDCPSGLEANTGYVSSIATKATVTITLLAMKQGLVTADAVDYCGELLCHSLEVKEEVFERVPANAEILVAPFLPRLPKRQRGAHKGDFGHVLIIGGAEGMTGAALMSAMAAARTGAGLVSVATQSEQTADFNIACPEIMCHEVRAKEDLMPLINKATVIVLGPGLGESQWGREMFELAIHIDKPKVVDADALNILSEKAFSRDDWVLTPHPGEAKRLLNIVDSVQQNRFAAIKAMQYKYDGIHILKGAGSLITDGKDTAVCVDGNPGMASGGNGDVLSGMIAALIAQGLSLFDAAKLGVHCHAVIADQLAEEGERGLLATESLAFIRTQLKNYE